MIKSIITNFCEQEKNITENQSEEMNYAQQYLGFYFFYEFVKNKSSYS